MAGNNTVKTDFVFNLDDKNMVSRLARIEEGMGGINNTLNSLGGKGVMLNQTFELVGKVADGVQAVFDVAQKGAANKDISLGFETQMKKLGISAQDGLGQFRKSVNDTVDDITLMQVANKGLISGLDPELIRTAMEYVTKYARQAGGDASQLLQTVLTGLTRGSTQFLDDVGIIISETAVVNKYTKEWGRSLTDAEKKAVILSEAHQQMNEKMVDFEGLADSQSAKLQSLVTWWSNWKNTMAEVAADVVVPKSESPAEELKNVRAKLIKIRGFAKTQEFLGVSSDKARNEEASLVEREQELIAKLDAQQLKRLAPLYSPAPSDFNANYKTAQALIDTETVNARTAGLDGYHKKLVEIKDEYEGLVKAANGDEILLGKAEQYRKIAESNAYKNLYKEDKKSAREAERLQKEIDRKEIQLTRENEKIKGEIKSAALNDYGDDRLVIEKNYFDGEIKAYAEFEADKEEIAKYHSTELDKLAKEKFDNEMARLGVKKLAEIDAWARQRAEEQRQLDWQTKMADMDLKYQQGIAALDLRKTTRDNKASYDDRFQDEYTQQLNALTRQRDEKFLETGSWDAAEGWYEQEKAALDYAAAIGTVSQNLTNFSKITNQDVKGAFEALESPLSTFIESMGEGKFQFGELISGIEDQLKIYAAGKTAHFLMEAAYSGYMGLIKSMNPLTAWEAPLWYSQSSQYLSSAAVMGSFVTGLGLAGMAHDGIDYIPKTGTWLIEEGERITDKRTNADLKSFLANPSMGGVNVSLGDVVINGGDEQGVLKALPQLEKTLTDAMIKAVTNSAKLKTAIKTYAR